MLVPAYFFLTITALIIATYTDLKERIVPNKLVYALGATALFFKAFESYMAASVEPLMIAIAGGAIAFAFSYILWKLGVWAGGDVKLVTVIALANPVNYAVLSGLLGLGFEASPLPVFGITLVIYSAFSVLPLGLLMSFAALYSHPQAFTKAFTAVKQKAVQIAGAALLISGMNIIAAQLSAPQFLVVPTILIVALLPKKIAPIIVAIVSVAGIAVDYAQFALGFIVALLPFLALYALWRLYSESKEHAFKKTIKTAEIEEGDVPDSYLVEENGIVEAVERQGIRRVIKNLMNNNIEKVLSDFKPHGKIIASPLQAGGLTKEQAMELRKKARAGKAPEELRVKKTMAFVPAILIGYLILQFTGDVAWSMLR